MRCPSRILGSSKLSAVSRCTWEHSDERRHWLKQIEALVEGNSSSEHLSGLNYWFDPRADGKTWPPDWRMTLVAYLAIFPLAYYLPPLMTPWLPKQSFFAAVISIGIMTVLMSYISLHFDGEDF